MIASPPIHAFIQCHPVSLSSPLRTPQLFPAAAAAAAAHEFSSRTHTFYCVARPPTRTEDSNSTSSTAAVATGSRCASRQPSRCHRLFNELFRHHDQQQQQQAQQQHILSFKGPIGSPSCNDAADGVVNVFKDDSFFSSSVWWWWSTTTTATTSILKLLNIVTPSVTPAALAAVTTTATRKLCSTLLLTLFILLSTTSITTSPTHAKNLLTENTIYRRYLVTDSSAILRYSLTLPSERVSDPQPAAIRVIQEALEKLGVHQKNGGVAGLIASRRDLSDLQQTLVERQLDVLLDVPARSRQVAAKELAKLELCVQQLAAELGESGPVIGQNFLPQQAVRAQQTLRDAFTPRNSMKQVTNYDVSYVESLRSEALVRVSEIEELCVEGSGPTFRIPRRYNNLPRLLGRAHVELELEKNKGAWQQPETLLNTTTSKTTITTTTTSSSSSKNNYTSQKSNNNNNKPTTTAKIRLTLDGYAAPITSGNFVDLVQRKWYDGMPIVSKQREFYTQFGALQRPGIDTTTAGNGTGRNVVREIPLEIMVNGEPEPVYGSTLDEAGIADLTPTLPVTAYGAVAMLHSVENANDASGPFYIFTLDPTSYQARSFGGSILTGSVATFAYVTDGAQWLDQLEPGDRIVSAKVIDGMENFRASGDR